MSPDSILTVGAGGLLGQALVRAGATGRSRLELDITDAAAVARALDELRPRAVINAAAYSAVDRAEAEPELARAVNRDGAAVLAAAAASRGLTFVHVSTDFVFDGRKASPYLEGDAPSPLGAYGRSKADGEAAVLAAHPGAHVVRTSWIFGPRSAGFYGTVMRLARERPSMEIVADQMTCPTYVDDLARSLLALVARGAPPGLLHLCGSPATTRHGFATMIVDEAARLGLVPRVPVVATTAAAFAAAAPRPAMSVLDVGKARAMDLDPGPWLDGLRAALREEVS